jgi:hypothetical protein
VITCEINDKVVEILEVRLPKGICLRVNGCVHAWLQILDFKTLEIKDSEGTVSMLNRHTNTSCNSLSPHMFGVILYQFLYQEADTHPKSPEKLRDKKKRTF